MVSRSDVIDSCTSIGTERHRDAGIALACNLKTMQGGSWLAKILPPGRPSPGIRVLELGAGCGIVGIAIAHVTRCADVLLTDLPEAREIVEQNIDQAVLAKGSSLRFQELDWDTNLPSDCQFSTSPLDLVVAADCTYNADSRYDFAFHL
jgi:predicted nicotinamide N-methyase